MIEIKINNFDNLLKIADRYPAIAEKHINKAIAKTFVTILNKIATNAPFGVTGHLRDNWETKIGGFQGSLKSKQNYSGSVEYGTRPHAVSAASLKDWAMKKGLNPYAVAKSIAKKGTRANPFLKKTSVQANDDIDKIMSEAINNITKDMV